MSAMSLREDVFDVEMWAIACSAFDALKGEGETEETTPVRTTMMKSGMKCLSNERSIEAFKSAYMVFPVVDTLTLGIYGLVQPGTSTAFALEKEKITVDSTVESN